MKGGSHLVLRVEVQDAFKAEADQIIERLKEDLNKNGIEYASIDRNDPQSLNDADQIQINIKGVPPLKAGNFRTAVSDRIPAWVLTGVNSTDYKLNMKPTESLKLKQDTVTQTIHTIGRKIDGLGLAETSVRPRGRADAEAEILVELPGVDDPGRIKQILQTTAMLELYEVKDGPFSHTGARSGQARRRTSSEYKVGARCTRAEIRQIRGIW